MKFLRKMIRKVFFGELDKFSQSLGYTTWNELQDNNSAYLRLTGTIVQLHTAENTPVQRTGRIAW